jgi:hypothetical protein
MRSISGQIQTETLPVIAVNLQDYYLMITPRDPGRRPTHPGAVLREDSRNELPFDKQAKRRR